MQGPARHSLAKKSNKDGGCECLGALKLCKGGFPQWECHPCCGEQLFPTDGTPGCSLAGGSLLEGPGLQFLGRCCPLLGSSGSFQC